MKTSFSELIKKYVSGSILPSELKQLSDLCHDSKHRSELGDLITEELKKERSEESGDQEIRSLIFDKLETQLAGWEAGNASGIISYKFFNNRFRRLFAAACVFLIVGGGFSLMYRGRENKLIAIKTPAAKTNIVPGGNKAVLTLADGSKIMLDDSEKGDIALQGGVKVIKLDNGILAYKGAGAAGRTMFNTITTPRGGQYEIVLPDGSHTWLNSSSSLRFPAVFSGPRREVELSGQGYFEVAANNSKPFIVRAAASEVKVLGTSFDIMAYEDEPVQNTTLVDGSVVVEHGGDISKLKPGEQAHLDLQSQKTGIIKADVEEVTAWKNGKFQFGRSNIKAIMRQLARWYDVEIEYKGDLSGVQLSGILSRKENASQLLDAFEETGDVHFITEGKKITVVSGPAK